MNRSQTIIKNQLTNCYVNPDFDLNKNTIIFLHGWRSEAKIWFPVIEQMQKKLTKYNYLAIDLPGFGSSPTPNLAWSMVDYSTLVNDLIIKLKLKKVILVGHSFGGRTSIKLAGEIWNSDDYQIEKIVLTGPAGFVDGSNSTNLKQKIAKSVKPAFTLPLISRFKPLFYKIIGADDYNAREDLKQIFGNIINEDLSEQMKKMKSDTLLIFGEQDRSTPITFGKRMNSLIQNSELKIIQKSGHFAFLDQQTQWLELVYDFMVKK